MKGQDDPHIKSIISHITANRDTFFPAEFTFEHSGRQKEVRELFGPLPGKLEDRMEDIQEPGPDEGVPPSNQP